MATYYVLFSINFFSHLQRETAQTHKSEQYSYFIYERKKKKKAARHTDATKIVKRDYIFYYYFSSEIVSKSQTKLAIEPEHKGDEGNILGKFAA